MNQQELFDEFYKALEPIAAADGATLEKAAIPRNNEIRQGIIIRFGDDPVAPTIYPERYRKTAEIGIPVSSIAKSVYGIAAEEAERIRRERIRFPFNREQAENHLMCAIAGYENNKEMLENLPYERLADLAVYVRWDYGNASAVLTNEGLSRLQMTKEEVLAVGKRNMVSQAAFQSLEEIMPRGWHGGVDDRGPDGHGPAKSVLHPDHQGPTFWSGPYGFTGNIKRRS